jgi:hypothetical protein
MKRRGHSPRAVEKDMCARVNRRGRLIISVCGICHQVSGLKMIGMRSGRFSRLAFLHALCADCSRKSST